MQPERNTSRRVFLRRAGKGLMAVQFSSALTIPSLAQEIPAPPGKKLGWAIVGLGRLAIGQILPAFARCERSRVVALVSGSPEKARNLALRYGVDPKNIYNYQNYDTLRNNPEVDVIYIVLPNGMHAEYTIRGAQAGKHILSEKPMANSAKDCREMIEACRKAGRKLMVAYRLRYEPYTQALIKIARDQELGPLKVVLADAGFSIGDPSQWRLNKAMAGGGSLMDIGIYALQAARYISGEEPIEVNAMETTNRSDPRFKEVEATINFQLRFPSGVLANCTSSYDASLNRFRGVTASGWFELEPGLSYTGLRMRVRRGNTMEERDYPQRDQFAAEMDQFSQCIMENRDVLTPGEEGLRDLQLMTAIYEATKAGKTIKLT
jgi:predicted dehydrogenase